MELNPKKKEKFLKTKIIATMGPSTKEIKTLAKMIQNGMKVARLNFSHGRYEEHLEMIQKLRKVSEFEDQPITILQDLSGPKIRLSELPEPVQLKRNEIIKLAIDIKEDAHLHTDFKDLILLIKPNDTIMIDDGYIELKVLNKSKNYVRCRVVVPGIAKSRRGINLPDISIFIPVFTAKDKKDLTFGLKHKVDMVAMSFVDSPSNINPIREMTASDPRNIPVIAKIERSMALRNIEGIIDEFDGIMIARGDLGVEVPPERVPLIQKELIKKANLKNKLTITATQMLESMIKNPRPTRAEASDISNAILDGSDAVMLSGETAIGKYPVKAVSMMRRIALATENSSHYNFSFQQQKKKVGPTEAIVRSAVNIARDLKAKYILVFSFTGNTAMKISKYRPLCPVFAFTSQKCIVEKMTPMWGIFPFLVKFTPQTDKMIIEGEELIKKKGLIKSGDLVVIVSGQTPMRGATNMLKLTRIP